MHGKEWLLHYSKFLLLLCSEEKKPYGLPWRRWVNDVRKKIKKGSRLAVKAILGALRVYCLWVWAEGGSLHCWLYSSALISSLVPYLCSGLHFFLACPHRSSPPDHLFHAANLRWLPDPASLILLSLTDCSWEDTTRCNIRGNPSFWRWLWEARLEDVLLSVSNTLVLLCVHLISQRSVCNIQLL